MSHDAARNIYLQTSPEDRLVVAHKIYDGTEPCVEHQDVCSEAQRYIAGSLEELMRDAISHGMNAATNEQRNERIAAVLARVRTISKANGW